MMIPRVGQQPRFQGVYIQRAESDVVGTSHRFDFKFKFTNDKAGADKTEAEKILGPFDGVVQISVRGSCFRSTDEVQIPGFKNSDPDFKIVKLTQAQADFLSGIVSKFQSIEPGLKQYASRILQRHVEQ